MIIGGSVFDGPETFDCGKGLISGGNSELEYFETELISIYMVLYSKSVNLYSIRTLKIRQYKKKL